MDQIFALQQIFEKSWEYAKEVNACFVDLEKAYDRIPRDKLWAVLLQYGIDGQLLTAIRSLYVHSEVCVCVNSATTKPFRVSVGLRQGCSLSPILFLIYMDRIVKKSESHGGVKIRECTVQRLLFADDLVLLDSTQNGLQQALDRFSDACSVAGMKISSTKTETMCLSRQPKQCSLQIDASHSHATADKIANWISASEKQVQQCASSTDLCNETGALHQGKAIHF